MTIHILVCPADGLAIVPDATTLPHDVKTMAYQQAIAARMIFIFHDVEKVTGTLFSSSDSLSLIVP